MKNFFDLKNINSKYKEFYERIELEKSSSIFGAVEPLKIIISSGFSGKILYVTSDYLTATKCFEMFYNIYKDRACLIKPVPDNLLYVKAKSLETLQENSIKLSKIANDEIDVVVLPISALMSYYPTKEKLKECILSLRVGGRYKINALKDKLLFAGYTKQDLVSGPGQYSFRGDILDIYPINENTLYRVEFFDEDVESICEIDGESMKKGKSVNKISIFASKNIFIDSEEKQEIAKFLEKSKDKKFDDNTTKEEYTKVLNDLLFKLNEDVGGYSLDYLMPIIQCKQGIFDYFEDFTVIVDECKMVYDEGKTFEKDLNQRIKELSKSGAMLSNKDNFIPFEKIIEVFNKNKCVSF